MTSQRSTTALLPRTLSPAQFQGLADVPPEIEWFANLTNANTRRAYQQDIEDFHIPSDYVVTRRASTGRGNVTLDLLYLSDGRLCDSSENSVNNSNMLEVYHEIRGNLVFSLSLIQIPIGLPGI